MLEKVKKTLAFLVTCASMIGLAACNSEPEGDPNDPSNFVDTLPTGMDHYYSNQISFADLGIALPSQNTFMKDGVAKLKIKSVTDGDTAVFHLAGGEEDPYTNVLKTPRPTITVRFLGIDTPESTSSIDPWGKKASKYVKSKLETAEEIIVDATSISYNINREVYPTVESTYVSGCRLDSNGSRWLALIWYCPDGYDANDLNNYRSLQLDVIEECYSFYTGNLGDTPYCYFANELTEPKLYKRYNDKQQYGSLRFADVLYEAEYRMDTLEKRYTGSEIDENYDYSTEPFRFADRKKSIKDAVDHFQEYSDCGKFIALTGVITGFIGCNFYFEDATGTPLYVYMGINAKSIESLFKVGDTIEIRGRLAEYGGQMQMSDIVFKKDTFLKIEEEDQKIALPDYQVVSSANLQDTELAKLMGKRVEMTLNTKKTGKQSKDKSFTLNTNNTVTYHDEKGNVITVQYDDIGIRFNGTLTPEYTYEEINETYTNTTVKVKGIMSIYYEMDLNPTNPNYTPAPSYQIVVTNRPMTQQGETFVMGSDISLA